MRTLVLLRHLKSSRDVGDVADQDRPLAPRGHRAGELIRRHLEAAGASPQLVLCSSAVRAVETWEAVCDGLPGGVRLEVEDRLYLASSESLLSRLNAVADDVTSVLVIAHNPGAGNLALGLAGTGAGDALERMSEKYPTGGLATLTFEGSWSALGWGDAELVEFVVPREL
jgi:phosphohistidine phosphatase